jgi:hypothetical protein
MATTKIPLEVTLFMQCSNYVCSSWNTSSESYANLHALLILFHSQCFLLSTYYAFNFCDTHAAVNIIQMLAVAQIFLRL